MQVGEMMKNNQIRLGIILNYVNMMVGTLIPIFYTPVMLRLLGQDEYGLYKLASSVTSYLGLISMGLGSAVSRFLIKAQMEEGREAEERVFGLFMIVFRCIAAIAFVIGLCLALNLQLWYAESLTIAALNRMRIIVVVLTVNAAISFLVSPYMSIVATHEKYLFQQTMNIMTTCAGPLLNLLLLYMGFASIGMAVSTLIAGVAVNSAYLIFTRRSLKIKARYSEMPFHLLKEIVFFSFWVFVSNIVSQLYNATDTVMIGAVPDLGTAGVAVYNLGTTFSNLVMTLTIGISTILTPRTQKMVFSGASSHELTELAIRVGRIQGYIVTLVVTGFIAFGRPFIDLYAGNGYKDSYWVAVLLMVNGLVPLVQSVCMNVIVAQNKHKFRSLLYLGIALANVFGTRILMKTSLGVVGAALMTMIAGVIGGWIVMNWYYSKKIGLEMTYFWKSVSPVYSISGTLCCVTLCVSKFLDFYNIWMMTAGIILYTLLFGALNWLFVMNEYEKDLILSPISKYYPKWNKRGAENGED